MGCDLRRTHFNLLGFGVYVSHSDQLVEITGVNMFLHAFKEHRADLQRAECSESFSCEFARLEKESFAVLFAAPAVGTQLESPSLAARRESTRPPPPVHTHARALWLWNSLFSFTLARFQTVGLYLPSLLSQFCRLLDALCVNERRKCLLSILRSSAARRALVFQAVFSSSDPSSFRRFHQSL